MPMPQSSDKLHFTMTKSSTFSGLRDALLAVTTFPAAEDTLSDFPAEKVGFLVGFQRLHSASSSQQVCSLLPIPPVSVVSSAFR